ncbi:MAG: hypothetical protein MZW92_67370 [Comamonadaceae bacterium]|nr:hypothetical protein [Comamonadaceae bacterium]
MESLQRTHADNVGGKMNAIGSTSFGKAVAMATSTPFGVGGRVSITPDDEEWVDTVYMGAWPRQVFEQIGLFDEELVRNQDDEFNYRLRAAGGRILLCPQIKSEYYSAQYTSCVVAAILPIRLLEGARPAKTSAPDESPPVRTACYLSLALLISAILACPCGISAPCPYSLRSLVIRHPCSTYLIANLFASHPHGIQARLGCPAPTCHSSSPSCT